MPPSQPKPVNLGKEMLKAAKSGATLRVQQLRRIKAGRPRSRSFVFIR